jgi:hypothetical protein
LGNSFQTWWEQKDQIIQPSTLSAKEKTLGRLGAYCIALLAEQNFYS